MSFAVCQMAYPNTNFALWRIQQMLHFPAYDDDCELAGRKATFIAKALPSDESIKLLKDWLIVTGLETFSARVLHVTLVKSDAQHQTRLGTEVKAFATSPCSNRSPLSLLHGRPLAKNGSVWWWIHPDWSTIKRRCPKSCATKGCGIKDSRYEPHACI